MVRDSVSHLRAEGRRVFLDAEHFFDGYASNPAYALEVLRAAVEAGADVAVLCDTNGGRLPDEVADVVHAVREATSARLGIHCHNDAGCAVANSLAAVDAGATHVQGTLNGYGERTGNADILTVVANLELKRSRQVLPEGRLREATRVTHAVSRAGQRAAVQPSAVRRGVRVRAQGRPARECRARRPDALPARGPGGRRQRHADARLGHGRPRLDRAQGSRAGLRPVRRRRRCSAGSPTRSRRWRRAATPSRPPTRPSSCCCAPRSRAPQPDFFQVESWRVIVDAHGDAHTDGSRRPPRPP